MNDQTEPIQPTPAQPLPPEGYAHPDPVPAAGPRFRDRVLGMRSVAAVALASLVLGGLGGAALGAVSAGGDEDRRGGPGGFGRPPFQQGQPGHLPQQGQPAPPAGAPGGVPPGTSPQEDDVQPDGSGDTTSGTNS
jgi:hypothetical protein